jgi:uncharacterized protein YjiK
MNAHNYKMALLGMVLAAGMLLSSRTSDSAERGGGLGARTNDARRQFVLAVDDYWRLSAPKNERFDASALLWREGHLLTVSDRSSELYEITLTNEHVGELTQTKFFSRQIMSEASRNTGSRYDSEGLAIDGAGRIYFCEESQRSVFRCSRDGSDVELLSIDWTPIAKYFKGGINASFEGIAVGNGKLYVANERESPIIAIVDLNSRKLEDSFFVDSSGFAVGGPHYTDLCFFDGRLFVLDRNHRCILEVDCTSRKVVAEHAFGAIEVSEEFAYFTDFPTGTMEGLAIDEKYFWFVTDNNGRGRFKGPEDFRPTLFRCKRTKKTGEAEN